MCYQVKEILKGFKRESLNIRNPPNNDAQLKMDTNFENPLNKIMDEDLPSGVRREYFKRKENKRQLLDKFNAMNEEQKKNLQNEQKIKEVQIKIESLIENKQNELYKWYDPETIDENSLLKLKKILYCLFGPKKGDDFLLKKYKEKLVTKEKPNSDYFNF